MTLHPAAALGAVLVLFGFSPATASTTGYGEVLPPTYHVEAADWCLVPIVEHDLVTDILALRSPSTAVGQNIVAVWFSRRNGTWETRAWPMPDRLAAIAFLKERLSLDDADDYNWGSDITPDAISSAPAMPSEKFGKGVLVGDPWEPVIDSGGTAIVDLLVSSGYSAAKLDIQSDDALTMDRKLDALAAIIESDLDTESGGAVVQQATAGGVDYFKYSTLELALQADGTRLLPDIAPLLADVSNAPDDFKWQSPAAGHLIDATGPLTVTFGGYSDGQAYTSHTMAVEAKDLTAPDVSISLNGGTLLHSCTGSLEYALAPEKVVVDAAALDAGDAITPVIKVNGATVPGGTIIEEPGIYVVDAGAKDQFGNATEVRRLFELRERQCLDVTVLFDRIDCIDLGDGTTQFQAAALIASNEFDPWDVHLGTLEALFFDDHGLVITGPHAVDGIDACASENPDGSITFCYGPGTRAVYEDGYWRVVFTATVNSSYGCPASIGIYARAAMSRAPDDFDFWTVVPAQATANADIELAQLGLTFESPATPPLDCADPEADETVSCQWQQRVTRTPGFPPVFSEDLRCGWTNTWLRETQIVVSDPGARPWGRGYSLDEGCLGSTSGSNSTSSSVTLFLFLSPAPPCATCQFTTTARPSLSAFARIDPIATATAGAMVAVKGGGVDAVAAGAVSAGGDPPETIDIFGVPVQVYSDGKTVSRTFQTPTIETGIVMGECAVTVQLGGSIFIDTFANDTILPNFIGRADATISGAAPNVSIFGVVLVGPCQGTSSSLAY